MVARYTQRNGASPKLVVLRPARKHDYFMLYLQELPTAEDLREIVLGSVPRATPEQLELMQMFVARMDIEHFLPDGANEEEELARPVDTPNPTLQLFRQKLLERSLLGENYVPFAPEQADARLVDSTFVEQRSFPRVAELAPQLESAFSLRQAETVDEPPRLYWSELLAQKAARDAKGGDGQDKDDSVPKEVSANHPVSDFKEMIDYRREDLVMRAIKQMEARIVEMIRNSVDGSFFEKALECLTVLRQGSVREGEAHAFNDFLFKLKEKFS